MCERFLTKGKKSSLGFYRLGKAYDSINWNDLWNVLRLYGLEGRLLKGVKSFYVNSRTCLRLGNSVSEWFLV